ncbi:metalloregulator ArsR/SmtB family transcription factor [Oscillospiraceae bacterium MB08-C2-2]|nr:metalloregulator ArsR/SmtB family transcription factor [Oscillospiraceae bacterium MB08-C2-2]
MDAQEQYYTQRAELLKALAHPVRLRILRELCVNQINVTTLYTRLGLPQSTISRHLLVLKNAGIVFGHRHGLEIDYSIDCDQLEPFIKLIIKDAADASSHLIEPKG